MSHVSKLEECHCLIYDPQVRRGVLSLIYLELTSARKSVWILGTSLVVWLLRLFASSAGGQGSIPDQGTRSHVPQLRCGAAKWIFKNAVWILNNHRGDRFPLWTSLTLVVLPSSPLGFSMWVVFSCSINPRYLLHVHLLTLPNQFSSVLDCLLLICLLFPFSPWDQIFHINPILLATPIRQSRIHFSLHFIVHRPTRQLSHLALALVTSVSIPFLCCLKSKNRWFQK